MIDPQASAVELLTELNAGRISSADLVAALAPATAWAEALGGTIGEPIDAASAAAASDRRRAAGKADALEGLPISIKANIGIVGRPTSAATPALAQHRRPSHSRVLREDRAHCPRTARPYLDRGL